MDILLIGFLLAMILLCWMDLLKVFPAKETIIKQQNLIKHLNDQIICPIRYDGNIIYIENRFMIKYKLHNFQDINSELFDKLKNNNVIMYSRMKHET